jgi:hypothetical protein
VRRIPSPHTSAAPRGNGVSPPNNGVPLSDTGAAPRNNLVSPRNNGVLPGNNVVVPRSAVVSRRINGDGPRNNDVSLATSGHRSGSIRRVATIRGFSRTLG